MNSAPAQPGTSDKAQMLRELHGRDSSNLNPSALSPFALSIFNGQLDVVKKAVEEGVAPDLMGTETPFKTGYASILVRGAQRVTKGSPAVLQHLNTLKYLFSKGLPPDIEDIVGFTALHHAATSLVPNEDLTRCLLENGADVNHRNRYGEVCLLGSMQLNLIPTIDILMAFGADLDLPDADGWTARRHFVACGPQVTAAVTKWIRKRTGVEAPRSEKCCNTCGGSGPSLLHCCRCGIARYCSKECQAQAWPVHRKACQPFSTLNTITLKPYYESGTTMPTAELTRQRLGYPTHASFWSTSQTRTAHIPKNLGRQAKTLVLKVQVPLTTGDFSAWSHGDLLLYTKKRQFACLIRRTDGPDEYDLVSQVVRTKVVGGTKAYFAAQLESRAKLVVKISEVLAEQPW
ncbi:ankyrin repeat-containing domain protein [Mycena vitilis]|nr:ankyrin repeat-containing domain protein [Mycena vitilis]